VTGAGSPIVNTTALEAAAPGVDTVTRAVPAVASNSAWMSANNCDPLPYRDASAVPFHNTFEPARKPAPVTDTVMLPDPAGAVSGLMLSIRGAGAAIVTGIAFDIVPFGFATVTVAVPPAAISSAGTAAVTCTALPKLVVKGEPFHRTTQFAAKFAPLAVSVNGPAPAVRLAGVIAVRDGRGNSIAILSALDTAPPGFTTVTLADAPPSNMLAGTFAVSCDAVTFVASAIPFHRTIAPAANPVPFTVNVNASPATADAGASDVNTAPAAFTTNVAVLDAAPFPFTSRIATLPAAVTKLAGTFAATWVALTTDVLNGDPFHCTAHPAPQFVPVAVNVNEAAPAVAMDGEIALRVGADCEIVNVCPVEIPAPPASATCSVRTPFVCSSSGGIVADNAVELTYVVVSIVRPAITTHLGVNPAPVSVTLTAPLPDAAVAGEIPNSTGEIVSGDAFEVVLVAGSETVRPKLPATARSSGVIATCSSVALTHDVPSA
jgi:hypothetical protein